MNASRVSNAEARARRIVADLPSISWKRAMAATLLVSGGVTLHAGLSLVVAAFGIDGMPLRFSFLGTNIFYGASLVISGAFALAVAARHFKRWEVQDREVRDKTILRAAFGDDPSSSRPR